MLVISIVFYVPLAATSVFLTPITKLPITLPISINLTLPISINLLDYLKLLFTSKLDIV